MSSAPGLSPRIVDGVHLLVDESAARRGVLVAFSDRRGGFSAAPYDSLNLALRVGDAPLPVAHNRMRVAHAAGFDGGRLALAKQVHGRSLIEVGPADAGVLGEADGLLAREPGPVLGILTADCAPVVLAGEGGVAVLHAGWRGVLAGVIQAGLAALGPLSGAWIGPSIHSCCYRVGPEVVAAFRAAGLPVAGPDRVDPGGAAAHVLGEAGVREVAVSRDCTYCSPHYFSYRRDGVTGRQGAFTALLNGA